MNSKLKLPVILLLVCVLLALIPATLRYVIESGPGYYKNKAESFRVRIQPYANIDEIQAWMAKRAKPAKQEDVLPDEWPDCIKKIQKPNFWVRFDGTTLELEEGSGFGHWGLRVGLPGTHPANNYRDEYQLPLTAEACVYHEIQLQAKFHP